jgi:hypothetical protein
MKTEPPPGSWALDDAILSIVRHMVASSPEYLRERLAKAFEALRESNHMRPDQIAVFLAQLVSDIQYAASNPEQKTLRPIAYYAGPRLLAGPKGSA